MKKNLLFGLVLMLFTGTQAFSQTAELESVTGNVGEQVLVPLNFTGMLNVGAVSIFIDYNESVLTFEGIENLVPEAQGTLANAMPGSMIGISWLAPGSEGVDFPDGKFFDLVFTYNESETTPLAFNDMCEIVDWDANVINVTYTGGEVSPETGSSSSAWNGTGSWTEEANWDNGVPGVETEAVIESGTVNVFSGANCKSLTINSGAGLIIQPLFSLTVLEDMVVDGSFVIESDATGTGSFINKGEITISGQSEIKRFLAGSRDYLVSSPVDDAAASVFGPLVLNDLDVSTLDWLPVQPGDQLVPGNGYYLSSANDQTYSIGGTPNYGDIQAPGVEYFEVTGADFPSGTNLVGNPYPSAISWDDSTLVKTNIDGAVYVWDGAHYLSWNGYLGGIANGVIHAMQGFLVVANDNNPELTLTNSSRRNDPVSFYKNEVKGEKLLALKVEGNGYSDHTYFHFKTGASDGFEHDYDAYKIMGLEEAPQLYSIFNDTAYSINRVAAGQLEDSVGIQLGLKVGVAGTYTVEIDFLQELWNEDFYIWDNVEQDSLNLKPDTVFNTYSFSADPGDDPNRFRLHFKPTGIGYQEYLLENARIFFDGQNIRVITDKNLTGGQIELFDVTGRRVINQSMDVKNAVLDAPRRKGMYILKLSVDQHMLTRKIIVH